MDRMILPKSEFIRTEFYNDYLRRFKVQGVLKAYLLADGAQESYLSFGSRWNSSDWDSQHVNLLLDFVPALRCALRVNARFSGSLAHEGALAALDRLDDGVFVVDEYAKPILMNRVAQAMVADGDGVSIRDRALHLGNRSEAGGFRRLIESIVSAVSSGGEGTTLTISRPSQRKPYRMLIAPVRGHRTEMFGRKDAAIVFIRDPEKRGHEPDTGYIRECFGLTSAEATIAAEIMRGSSVKLTAKKLGVAVSTVQSHLKRVFQKTGARRQAELIAMGIKLCARLELSSKSGSAD
jgi:DNA-binding CsgD family transcriptional regulator